MTLSSVSTMAGGPAKAVAPWIRRSALAAAYVRPIQAQSQQAAKLSTSVVTKRMSSNAVAPMVFGVFFLYSQSKLDWVLVGM